MVNEQDPGLHTITIRILNRDFQFKCEKSEKEQLYSAADYLNECAKTIKQSGRVIDYERIIVMAALNICNQALLNQQEQQQIINEQNDKIAILLKKIDSALHKSLELG